MTVSESVVPPAAQTSQGIPLPVEFSNARYLILPPGSKYPVDFQAMEPVYSGPDAQIFRYRYALPRAFLFSMLDGERSCQAIQRLECLSPRQILEQGIGSVDVAYADTEHVQLSFCAARPSILVLLDRTYPGWNAFVGDAPVTVKPVFGIMRAVEVAAGQSRARFVFDPPARKLGLALSLFASVAAVAICFCGSSARW